MDEIHSLVKHGGGGFEWWGVWHMPIFMRRYHIDQIIKENEERNAAQAKQMR